MNLEDACVQQRLLSSVDPGGYSMSAINHFPHRKTYFKSMISSWNFGRLSSMSNSKSIKFWKSLNCDSLHYVSRKRKKSPHKVSRMVAQFAFAVHTGDA